LLAHTIAACEFCKKPASEAKLKHYAKCSVTQYCSRECQKSDWKTHKKICGKQEIPATKAQLPDRESDWEEVTAASADTRALDGSIAKPFTRINNGTWLHNRPEKDVYKLLIDTYRMKMEDQYKFEGDADVDSIYGGASDGKSGFERFLKLVEAPSKRHLLPSWWSPEHMPTTVPTVILHHVPISSRTLRDQASSHNHSQPISQHYFSAHTSPIQHTLFA